MTPKEVADIARANGVPVSKKSANIDGLMTVRAARETRAGAAPRTAQSTADKPAKPYGASNTLVTADKYAEIKAKLKAKLSQANIGLDPELLTLATQAAIYHVEAGARKFADFARTMVSEFGDAVKPYLKRGFNNVRDDPDMPAAVVDEMDDYAAVKAADLDAILAEAENSNAPPADDAGTIEAEADDVSQTGATAADDRPSDAGPRDDVPKRPGTDVVREPQGGSGGAAVSSGNGGDTGGRDSGAQPDAEGRSDGGGPVADPVRKPAGRGRGRAIAGDGRSNYLAPVGSLTRQGSWRDTAARNVEIIKLVKQLEADQKLA